MTATFLVGDVFDRLVELPDGSVDLVLTSPPFGWLRSYLPDDHPDKAREIGHEPTPAAYLDVLLQLTAEVSRVLAPHGSLAVELGDTFSGSGGAGGDYNPDGLREGQERFDGTAARARYNGGEKPRPVPARSRKPKPGWPLEKGLVCIPQLYQIALAYGINPLTGEESPAGMWRVRNVKPWIKSNPPVGALGDKERPATSYVIVACRTRDRWFDLDAVRTQAQDGGRPRTPSRYGSDHNPSHEWGDQNDGRQNPVGAPPRDWWHHVDAVLDACLDQMAGTAGPMSFSMKGRKHTGQANPATGWDADSSERYEGHRPGARGVHLRRALEAAGILSTAEALDISPKGYAGSHYAVWPPELCRLLIDEMCPRRVCVTCGQPSRRITGRNGSLDASRPQSARAMELAEVAGLTPEHVAAIRAHGIHDAGKAKVTQAGAGKNSDEVKRLAAEAKEALGGYFREFLLEVPTTTGWSSCGCPDTDGIRLDGYHTGTGWRPGVVLDPFVGSGTTLAVASGMGRDSIGIDLDESNIDLVRERVGLFLDVVESGSLFDTAQEPA